VAGPERGAPGAEDAGPGRGAPWRAIGMNAVTRAVICVVALSGLQACARVHARTAPIGPPLEIPQPPPRVVVPVPEEVVELAPPPVEAPAVQPPSVPVPRAAAPRAPERPAPAVPASKPVPENPAGRSLQTTGGAAASEQQIRAMLSRASQDLSRVDSRTLSAEARAQYDIARRFMSQSEDAIKDRNLVFATTLAEKAAALAGLLLER
jgi:hypothetical protein